MRGVKLPSQRWHITSSASQKCLGLPNWLNNCKPADEIEPESPLSILSHGPYPFDSRHAASSFVTVSFLPATPTPLQQQQRSAISCAPRPARKDSSTKPSRTHAVKLRLCGTVLSHQRTTTDRRSPKIDLWLNSLAKCSRALVRPSALH